MDRPASPYDEVTQAFPHCRRGPFSKQALLSLSHGMEDQARRVARDPIIFATFQESRFLVPSQARYRRLARRARFIGVFAAGATAALPLNAEGPVPVDIPAGDPLLKEWHVVIAAENFMALLLCKECDDQPASVPDPERRFEGVWTFEPQVVRYAADLFMARVAARYPDLSLPAAGIGGDAAWALPYVQPLTARILGKLQEAIDLERQRRLELEAAYAQTVSILGGAVEAKDHETGEHVHRVMALADRLGRALGWCDERLRDLRFGAALHDIGKIGVPEAVLTKPGPLDAAELATMRRHPLTGAALLEGLPALHGAVRAVRHHHERWDGKGYPDALGGDSIPAVARVVAIADVFDALRSDRPYRAGWSLERVLDYMRDERGQAFEPALVDALLDTLASGGLPGEPLPGEGHLGSALSPSALPPVSVAARRAPVMSAAAAPMAR